MKLQRSIAIYHVVFLFNGIITVMLGVLLAHSAAGDFHSGTLMSTQFSGQVVGSLIVTQRPHRTLLGGLILSIAGAVALACLATPVLPVLFLLGLGIGCVISNVNTAAGLEVEPAKRGSVLELLNVFWPIGAASAPIVGSLFRGSLHVYGLLGALFIPCVLWLVITRPRQAALVERQESTTRTLAWAPFANLCLLAFLVVGIETGIASWLPTLAQRDDAPLALAAAIPTGYWCGSLASRLTASAVLRRLPLYRLNAVAAIGTLATCMMLPFATNPTVLLAASIAVAVSIAPLFPALLAGCVDVKFKGIIFMCAGLGSAAAPWAVGKLSASLGSLHRAEWLSAAGAMAMIFSMAAANMFRPEPRLS